MKKVSILSRTFNEEGNIRSFYERVTKVMEQFPQYDYEILIADNCSQDETVDILRDIAANDNKVKVILNAKNFGISRSSRYIRQFYTGDCVISMASDLQDPPEIIAELLRHWEDGKKMVVAVKSGSEESIVMRTIRKLYYRIVNAISSVEQINDYGFMLVDKSIMDKLMPCFLPGTYGRGLYAEYGYDIATVSFIKPKRKHGKSSFNFFSYFDVMMMAVTYTSKTPIRIATLAGLFLSILSFLIAAVYFILRIFWWPNPPWGIGPLLVGMFFFASVQILFLGLIGEYVAAILAKVTPKPLVMVREYINFDNDEINNE